MKRISDHLLLTLCASVWLWNTAVIASERPNIVMIVGDDMGWTDFGFMGSKIVHTPNLDKLAGESTLFPNGYVPTSLCRASLATLLTGLYGHQHQICCNDPPEGVNRAEMNPFMRRAPALPRLLSSLGYVSLQTGKFWEGHYVNAGFTEGMTVKGRHGDDGLVIGRTTMKPIEEFLDRHKGEPFFLWYAPMLPHEPHNPPDRLLAHYKQEGRPLALVRYYAMCEWFDETCGELLRSLEKRGLSGNTLVVFVVDNGWIQSMEPPKKGMNHFDPKSKRSPYDGGVRTPILFRWPGKIPVAKRNDLISTIDLAPTMLAAAGMTPPPSMQGINLLPFIEEAKPIDRDAVFGEIFVHTCVELGHPGLNLTHRWVREGDWKLIVPADANSKPELFNLSDDPHEKANLASDRPEQVTKLNDRLKEWWNGH